MNTNFFESLPSIQQGKKDKIVYGRLFIPYTINGFYIMGANKISNDYKLFVVEKWNTPFILKINYREILLSELTNEYNTLKLDTQWNTQPLSKIFTTINNLYNVQNV